MVEQRKAQRLAVLRELYTAAAGSTDEWVPRARFAGHADAATPIEVLRESGLVETRDGAIRLTASGLRDVEASYEPPPKPPPPPIHVEHHVSLSGTNVQYASPGASQTNITVIDAGAIEAMQGVVAELQRLAGVVSNAEQKQLLEANRQRLEFELATKAPNRPVVEAILTSLRTATEGMLSSAMYDGLRATLRVARRFFGA